MHKKDKDMDSNIRDILRWHYKIANIIECLIIYGNLNVSLCVYWGLWLTDVNMLTSGRITTLRPITKNKGEIILVLFKSNTNRKVYYMECKSSCTDSPPRGALRVLASLPKLANLSNTNGLKISCDAKFELRI